MDEVHPSVSLNLQPSCHYAKKKALCIGINYLGNDNHELKGCINDAKKYAQVFVRCVVQYKPPYPPAYDPFWDTRISCFIPSFFVTLTDQDGLHDSR